MKKHKITQVEEINNEEDKKVIKDTKEYHKTILKLVASIALGGVGWTMFEQGLSSPDFAYIPMALGVLLQFVCWAKVSPKLIAHLRELRGVDEEKDKTDDMSGGLKKWTAKKAM